jgi:hypothetical protein
VRDSNYEKIIAEASSCWTRYTPIPLKCTSAGIDSSWNKRAFQGLSLYVVDAVAVTSENRILGAKYESELSDSARQDMLESKAMEMELELAEKAAQSTEADITCIDGSVVPRVRTKSPIAAQEIIRRYDKAVFISKSSESRSQFGGMGSRAGDIYYYGRASAGLAGFSQPEAIQSPDSIAKRMYEVYVRVKDNTPMIRLEVSAVLNESEVKRLINQLCFHSVSGYPYCLKLAHNNCKISNEDIDRLASILSLQHETGARDALNE